MDRKLTLYILAGMVLGVIVGQMLNQMVPADVIKESIAPWFKLLSDIFLNLIKMLVAPLVLSTIVVGIAHMGDSAALGRIGVAAVDLATGEQVMVLGDQLFPMASTSKVAIAATFLEMVEQGRYTLTSEFPLMMPVASAKYSSTKAPVRAGQYMPAIDLIEIMITRSSNPATDALLAAVGGPAVVNDWMRRKGIGEFSINRDIATLVRDDGEHNPAYHIDTRDAATPRAMVRLLSGLYRGEFLSDQSRQVLLSAMSRTVTGKRRIPAHIPLEARVSHKTGSLSNTSSDIGLIECPDGRVIAVAIYVTGQGTKLAREERIAAIARALYDGFAVRAQLPALTHRVLP